MKKYSTKPPAILLLEDGTVFYGKAAGIIGTTTGEICFNTGMTGYQEIFTDPSYYGQIMVTATAHIGNYGMHSQEDESDSMKIAGLVCKNFSVHYSREGDVSSAQDRFEREEKVVITDVDTRAVVRHIRDKGAMNAVISSKTLDVDTLKAKLDETPSMEGLELSSKVSTSEAYDVGSESASYRVAVMDYGVKQNIIRCLNERDCFVRVFPMDATMNDILDWGADGILLSNGPGDPAPMQAQVEEIGNMIGKGIPIMGICLGHQLLALSQGLSTEKMHAGHRGINHPVINKNTQRDEITSQNHGFVVKSVEAEGMDEVVITHVHLNDQSVAGLEFPQKNAFSVQYHPEACPGPHDPRYLFDDFVQRVADAKKNEEKIA